MDRTSRVLIRRIVIDFLCLFVVGMTILTFFLFGEPKKRGYFCNDETIAYPYKKASTVTSTMLYFTGLVLPITTMIACEYHYSRGLSPSSPFVIAGRTIPRWFVMAYKKVGIFGFGAAMTVMTTDVAKYQIGRLRPHFMTLCQPKNDFGPSCSDSSSSAVYISDFHCTTNPTARELKEMRLSFPSGHSSFAAYTMIYLALYLQLRFTWKGSKLLRHFLQFICILMAWYTAMTRVADYKHHWSDVLAGLCIGTVVALITAFGIADLFGERRKRHHHEGPTTVNVDEKNRDIDYESSTNAGIADGTQVNNGTGNNHNIC